MDEKKKFSPAFETAQALVEDAREKGLSRGAIRHLLDDWIVTISSATEAQSVRCYVREDDRQRFFIQWLELVRNTVEALELTYYDAYVETPDEISSSAIGKAIALADNHKEAMTVWFCADDGSEFESKAFEKAISLCACKDDIRDVCKEVVDAVGGCQVLDYKDKFILAFNRADELPEKPQESDDD